MTDTSKKKVLQKMEEKLASMEFRNNINEQRYKESMKTIAFIKEQLKSFLQTLDPEDPILKEMEEEALTEPNMMKYLAEVEQRANKIIQSYALIQAQKLQTEAMMKEDPELHKSNIAALNNVMALGSQTMGNTAPITIPLPVLQDEEDDGMDVDDEEIPLPVDELRARAERTLQNWKLTRSSTNKPNKPSKRNKK